MESGETGKDPYEGRVHAKEQFLVSPSRRGGRGSPRRFFPRVTGKYHRMRAVIPGESPRPI